jgi:uncharacterized phage protein gp47/JayE
MADYQYIDATGLIVPDTAAVQAEVEAEYKAVFGQDLVVTPNTPQGVLIAAEVTARANILRNNAAVANQINPNLAGGVFLDAIWALTGGQRIAASYSVIPGVHLIGLSGTVVPAGSQASLVDGTLFASVSAVTLDGSGNGYVDFQAVDTGPIAANVGALTQIVTAVLGWDQVTNPTAATMGRNVESDLAGRMRRKNTLSLQNVALSAAITSALYDVPNVRSLTFRENYTNATATIDGISLLANSVWACVDGGTDAAIAAALLSHKSLGANWNGATTVNVVDAASGQTYPVKFDRPADVPVKARVTVRNVGALVDVPSAVRLAITNYAAGLQDGEAGFVVGASVSSFELAAAVNRENPGIYVQNCEISLVTPTSWVVGQIAIALDEIASITDGNIEVIVV